MITIDTKGIDAVVAGLVEIPRSLKYAIPNFQNAVAFGAREFMMQRIREVFPTARPQTAKNVFVKKATANNSVAVLLFDQIYKRDPNEYMVPNVDGGARSMKPSEKRLGHYYVPGKGAQIDAYGNMKGGQITQILSRLGKFSDTGFSMNQTGRSKAGLARSKKTGKKSSEYFVVTQPTGGLKPGVYQRTSTGKSVGRSVAKSLSVGSFQQGRSRGGFFSVVRGRGVSPVMVFTRSVPSYKAVWPFWDDARKWIDSNCMRIANEIIVYELERERSYRGNFHLG